MAKDETEEIRRALVPEMPTHLVAALLRGETAWSTAQLIEEFEVLGFLAPFVAVRRKADGVRGTMQFTHDPRWYFGWLPE